MILSSSSLFFDFIPNVTCEFGSKLPALTNGLTDNLF